MNDWILASIGPTLIAMTVLVAGTLLGATIYDVTNLLRRSRIQSTVRRLRKDKQPRLTILIYVSLQAGDLKTCLQYINRSRYQHLDIVVVANHTSKKTRQSIRAVMQTSNHPIKLYALRKRGSQQHALYQAYKRSRHGDIIVTLTPSDYVTPSLFKHIAAGYVSGANRQATKLGIASTWSPSIAALLDTFARLSNRTIHKARSVLGIETTVLKTGYAFLPQAFRNEHQKTGWRYESDLVLYQPSVSQKQRTVAVHILGLLVAVAAVVYSIAVVSAAATLKTNTPFLLTWLLVCFWLASIVWLDDRSSLRQKLILSVCIPPSYFIAVAAVVVYPFMKLANNSRVKLQYSLGRNR